MKMDIFHVMKSTGKRNFKTLLHCFRIQNNPPSVFILNKDEIPGEYIKVPEPAPDKTAIKAALRAGKEVPGVELRISESLRIS